MFQTESHRIIEHHLKEGSKAAPTLLDGGIVGADLFVNQTYHIVGLCYFYVFCEWWEPVSLNII